MLVLSRRVGESVVIAGEITVTVLDTRGDVVRIGIDAPKSVNIHRAELLAEVAEVNADAASPSETAVASLTEALKKRS